MADFSFGIGEELRFTTQDTNLTHSWNFGDGTMSTEPNPTHLYSTPDVYTVIHSSKDFCGVCAAVSHTIEIAQASITVRSILLDKYTAKVGDIVTVTIIAQNLSSTYGTGTIVLKFDSDVIDTFNVTLDVGQEVTFDRQKQVIKAGTINICADSICTALFVESQVSVKSVILSSNISIGEPIVATIDVQNVGTFTEDKEIKTTLTNVETIIFDARTLTVSPGEIQTYNVIVDVTALSNGVYTLCAENICKTFSVAKSVVATGSLAISSVPTGAEIFVDGESKGQFTNATVTGIPAGNHTFRLKLSGYNDVTSEDTEPVIITGGMTTYIHMVLSPLEPTTGSISISTITPANADIYIDGATIPTTTTPATISGLPPGHHNIILKMSGYENFSYTINVTVGQTSYIQVSMTESPKLTGSINFTSVPDGAEIWLENKTTGLTEFTDKYTPGTILDISIGTYTFTLKSPGHMNATGIITVVGGVISHVYAVLPLVSAIVGNLIISSVPQGADIYIDGTKQLDISGQPIITPTTIELSPKIGYNVTLKKAGYNDYSTIVDIIAGQASYVGVTLSPLVLIITAQAGIPWWLMGGLVVGMYYTSKKLSAEIRQISLGTKPRELLEAPKGQIITLTKKDYTVK